MTAGLGEGAAGARASLRAALPGWVAARLAVAISFGAAHLVVGYLSVPSRAMSGHLGQGLLGWDARWYVDIASRGYDHLPLVGVRFFPLFPALARITSLFTLGRAGPAVLVVANGLALVLGALIHRLCVVETGDVALGRRAAWLVALTPASFVLVWGYAEALAGCLAVAAFLALRTRRWWLAALAGLLAGLTRPVGTLLALPAAVEAARGLRDADRGERLARLAAVGAPFAGCGLYLAWVGIRFGDGLLPLTIQGRSDFRGGLANPIRVLWGAGQDLVDGHLAGNAGHLPWALLLVVLTVVVFRQWPASYGAFAAGTVGVALTAERLGSLERYGFGAFPIVLALAVLGRSEAVERIALAVGAAAMTAYATLALLGVFVP